MGVRSEAECRGGEDVRGSKEGDVEVDIGDLVRGVLWSRRDIYTSELVGSGEDDCVECFF